MQEPEISLKVSGEETEHVEELKLLGVKVTTDTKWKVNTEYVTRRAYKKLWILRRLRAH